MIPYYPLSDEMLASIVRLQLDRIEKRVHENHKIPFDYDDEVVKLIVEPLHGAGKRRADDRRDPHQHGAAADQRGVSDAPGRGQADDAGGFAAWTGRTSLMDLIRRGASMAQRVKVAQFDAAGGTIGIARG